MTERTFDERRDAWREYPGAPAPGTPIVPLGNLPLGEVTEVEGADPSFSMLLVRRGPEVCAFVNACPHLWLPLTYRSKRVLSADAERLRCSNHTAEFALPDGRALCGPAGVECGLDIVPVQVRSDGMVTIAPDEPEPPSRLQAPSGPPSGEIA